MTARPLSTLILGLALLGAFVPAADAQSLATPADCTAQDASELALHTTVVDSAETAPAEPKPIPCSTTITCSSTRCASVRDCENYPNSTWVDLSQEALQACIDSANSHCASRGCGPAQTGIVSGSETTCRNGVLCVNVELPYWCSSN